jgi:hypothetical protein
MHRETGNPSMEQNPRLNPNRSQTSFKKPACLRFSSGDFWQSRHPPLAIRAITFL